MVPTDCLWSLSLVSIILSRSLSLFSLSFSSLSEYRLFYWALLQKRPIALSLVTLSGRYSHMRWLRSVGSLKLQVSFAEYRLFYWALLQKRPIALSLVTLSGHYSHMKWLRSVGSLKLQVSFAEYRLCFWALLQKRPIVLSSGRSLLSLSPLLYFIIEFITIALFHHLSVSMSL